MGWTIRLLALINLGGKITRTLQRRWQRYCKTGLSVSFFMYVGVYLRPTCWVTDLGFAPYKLQLLRKSVHVLRDTLPEKVFLNYWLFCPSHVVLNCIYKSNSLGIPTVFTRVLMKNLVYCNWHNLTHQDKLLRNIDLAFALQPQAVMRLTVLPIFCHLYMQQRDSNVHLDALIFLFACLKPRLVCTPGYEVHAWVVWSLRKLTDLKPLLVLKSNLENLDEDDDILSQ